MQNLVCFAKKSVNRKPFLVWMIFSTRQNFLNCYLNSEMPLRTWPDANKVAGTKLQNFKFFATASANRVEIRIYALISVVPCPILPTRLARISSDTAVFSPQQHRYFCASRGLSQWGKNKRKERDSISFLSFLPCCERPLLAGNIIAEGVIATQSNRMKFRLPLTPHLTWCMYLVL